MSSTQTYYSAVVSSPIHTIFTFTYFNIKINYHIQYENIFLTYVHIKFLPNYNGSLFTVIAKQL